MLKGMDDTPVPPVDEKDETVLLGKTGNVGKEVKGAGPVLEE